MSINATLSKPCAEKVIDFATLFGVSVQTQGGIVGCVCVLICRKWSYASSGNMVAREKKNKLVELKAFIDTVGIRSTDLIDKFFF